MEIPLSDLASHLDDALAAARAGEDVILTEGGLPVAKLGPVESASLLERLAEEGVIAVPASDRAVPRLPQAEAAKDALSSLLGRLRR
ncbi:type II toxin-antitoxin system prevent-host-death family antitoxin [Demequina silvatica]|uniref:type II toxin-antitoxin system prevent-host-death family antitoxin n=1 Tax=Demequina silvatica TaxID=1638988 RepID=UPI0007852410|nr:type II toxin-antitoxin system prevent-host-death family antitoxin [Demequina silvatica]